MSSNAIPFHARVLHAAQTVAGVLALWGIERVCGVASSWLGVPFPSSVAAMLGIFASLLALRALEQRLADNVARALSPARVFLTRWMALFFVPPLVQLPLNAVPALGDFLACGVIVGGGFCLNLMLTAWVASLGRAKAVPAKPQTVNVYAWPRRVVPWMWCVVGLAALGASGVVTHAAPLVVYGVAIAVLGFVGGEWGRERLSVRGHEGLALVFHPVLISAGVAGLWWVLAGQPLSAFLHHGADATFVAPGNWLMALLAPAVVSLGLVLDNERDLLWANVRPLLAATATGAVFSLLLSAVGSRLLGLSEVYARALLPKAVTTPVALVIAELFDANAGLTAVFVVLSGVLGALFAAPLLRRLKYVAPFVQGVATGVSSHGIGTAALVRDNPGAAGFSAIAFALTAAMSVAFASLAPVRFLIEWLLTY